MVRALELVSIEHILSFRGSCRNGTVLAPKLFKAPVCGIEYFLTELIKQ